MSNHPTEWAPSEERNALAIVPVVVGEFKRRSVMMVSLFATIALLALALGIVLPRKYTSSTTILVEEGNIIAPLMEGRAVPTGVANRAGIAKEVAFSRKVMNEILVVGGWMAKNPSPVAQDKLIEEIIGRTQITTPRDNLIRIEYTDKDPKRAYDVTRRLAELVIQESLANKSAESRQAYEFIDSQVNQYHAKLAEAESKLEQYRTINPDARPGIETDVNARIGELRRQVETARMDLLDLRSQEQALQAQLSGEAEVTLVQTRAGTLRARLAELQSERDRLLLNYTEQHPDVVRVQHQIVDLQQELGREDSRKEQRLAASPSALEGSSQFNPLYGELRSKLAEVRRRGAAMAARASTAQGLLDQELTRSGRIASSESTLAELMRDYEVNRDLYQDLLKRRENARVSMNLDAERRGLSFRVQEPASMPLRPSGLRLMHVAGAGLIAALLIPAALLLGFVKLDPRVRSPWQIERDTGLPVLGTVPVFRTAKTRAINARRAALCGVLFLSVPVVYALVLALKLVQAL